MPQRGRSPDTCAQNGVVDTVSVRPQSLLPKSATGVMSNV